MTQPVRTEYEVAADTILALLDAKLFRPGKIAQVLSDASIAAKVPMSEIRAAAKRWEHRKHIPPPVDRPAGDVDRPAMLADPPKQEEPPSAITPDVGTAMLGAMLRDVDPTDYFPAPAPAPAVQDSRIRTSESEAPKVVPIAGRKARRDKGEARQLCLSCHTTKAESRFRIANVETGRRSRSCIPCEDDRNTRSVAVDQFHGGLRATFMLHEHDEIGEARCAGCRQALPAGTMVELVGPVQHADDCPGARRTGS